MFPSVYVLNAMRMKAYPPTNVMSNASENRIQYLINELKMLIFSNRLLNVLSWRWNLWIRNRM